MLVGSVLTLLSRHSRRNYMLDSKDLRFHFSGHYATNIAVSLSFLRPEGTNFSFDLLHRLRLVGDIIQLA